MSEAVHRNEYDPDSKAATLSELCGALRRLVRCGVNSKGILDPEGKPERRRKIEEEVARLRRKLGRKDF